jgi:hypothetical protein
MKRPPLLRQLQEAVRPSGEAGGSGSGGGPGAPLDLAALDLLVSIESEVNHRYWLVCKATRRRWGWTLPQRIEYWVGQILDEHPDQTEETATLLGRWVQQIEDLFDPPRRVDIPRACPECRHLHVLQLVDGETVRNTALVAVIREASEPRCVVTCRVCGAGWQDHEWEGLEQTSRALSGIE